MFPITDGMPPRRFPIVSVAIERAGLTVSSAGVILAGTFAALTLTALDQLVQMGSSIAFGVLLTAFLIAPIWVTSRAAVLARWMWWPGNHPRRSPAEAPTGSGTPPSLTWKKSAEMTLTVRTHP